MDDFEGFKTSLEDITVDMTDMVRELESELKPEDIGCNFMIRLERIRSCLEMAKESDFSRWNLFLVKMV